MHIITKLFWAHFSWLYAQNVPTTSKCKLLSGINLQLHRIQQGIKQYETAENQDQIYSFHHKTLTFKKPTNKPKPKQNQKKPAKRHN